MNELPNRKTTRLKDYDYRSNGVYHVTICTRDKACLFGRIADRRMIPNEAGKAVEEDILSIPRYYAGVYVVSYVVMPNHVHLLIELHEDADAKNGAKSTDAKNGDKSTDAKNGDKSTDAKNGVPTRRHSLGQIIGAFKAGVSRKLGQSVWQPRFYEHIIRGERDYLETIEYIQNNPAAWEKDDCYVWS